MKKILLLSAILISAISSAQQLSGTYMVAQRDTCNLYIDVYLPTPGSETTLDGAPKPTILYVFGGGFITGRRNDPFSFPWFKTLNDNGYGVVSVDYRLGLKGVEMKFDLFHLFQSARYTKRAVDIGVEDVFAAVRWLCDNAETAGIDPYNMVIAGSSAGAMISLSCELETCSPTERTAILPEGFRFKGVMSFAGAVMSDSGIPKYQAEPAPHLLFHGTADEAVAYDKIAFGRYGMFGSNLLVEKIFSKRPSVYEIYRYKGMGHSMAGNMLPTWPEQKRFLEINVIGGKRRIVDALVEDPTMPVLFEISVDDIY